MRPINKKHPGEEVEYLTSNNNRVTHIIQTEYDPYGDAKDPLAANIGHYCSYCEEYRALGDLHIEHIQSVNKGGDKKKWNNFLLSCNICNSCKLNKPIDINETHFPHVDNTFLDFIYEESGRIKINPFLDKEEYKKAETLYNLVKLGRGPLDKELASERDYRWSHRFETWTIANRQLELYALGKIEISDIITNAKTRGNWSIWFTIFGKHNEVRKALIENIPGTSADCFDKDNNYEPITRNP